MDGVTQSRAEIAAIKALLPWELVAEKKRLARARRTRPWDFTEDQGRRLRRINERLRALGRRVRERRAA